MGSIHQLAEQLHIVVFQRFHRTDGPLIFIDRMFCPFLSDRILNGIFMHLKLFLCQVSQRLDLHLCLQLTERRLTFISSVIVCRIHQAVFYLAVGDHDLCILEHHRRILIVQRIRIQENRMILFPHSTGKLIHDTAVAAVKVVFSILSDQCDIHHAYLIKSKDVL